MSEEDSSKTRPSQLMPTGADAVKALEGFLHIMGFNPGATNSTFDATTKTAYDQARAQYSFLPELSATPDEASLAEVFRVIDRSMQTDVAFQQRYLEGVNSATNATDLQGALVAGGSWANRHLGDHISEAESIKIDGSRGTLTNRGVRNAATMTGVATMQSSLNLLMGTNLSPTGIINADTLTVMASYAQQNNLTLSGDTQQNFILIMQDLEANQAEKLHDKVAEVLNADTDYKAPDPRTLDAQIVMNGFARQQGLDIRTAPDGRQTDNRITAEKSHTRTMIAPQTGVELTPHEPTAGPEETMVAEVEPTPEPEHVTEPPFGLNEMYRVTRHDVLDDVKSIADTQNSNPNSPQHILAYSEEARGFLLISKTETEGQSNVYQISDRNVSQIMSGINDGSIAMDVSARKYIAEIVHGNSTETTAYSTEELRAAFAEKPTRYTTNTHEKLLTTSAHLSNGETLTFGLDDLHDALTKLDSKRDWNGQEDRVAVRDYMRELRDATSDAKNGRYVNIPEWPGGELTAENSVELNIGGNTTRVPSDVWNRISDTLASTQRGFSTDRDYSTLERTGGTATVADSAENTDRALSTNFGAAGEYADDPITANAEDMGAGGAEDIDATPEEVLTAEVENAANATPARPV